MGQKKNIFGITDIKYLSTGCKTVLCYLYLKKNDVEDIVIDVTECGYNALDVLFDVVDRLEDNDSVFILRHKQGLTKCKNRNYSVNGHIDLYKGVVLYEAYSENVLEISFQSNTHFRLVMKGRIVQVYGESATGKSLLGYVIKETERYNKKNNDVEYDVSNIICVESKEEFEQVKGISGYLVIIDRGDTFLNDTDSEYIREDRNNSYLIISRLALGLGISPNYYAEFYENDGVIELKYKYNVE